MLADERAKLKEGVYSGGTCQSPPQAAARL
jgi:hypothetical protein